MAFSKRSVGWCKVYVMFPLAPVLIESVLRVLFGGPEISAFAVPAYSTALVSIMAISIFLHDELSRYRLPDPDEELVSELTGNRYTMIFYFLFSCTLFSGIVLVSLLSENQHLVQLNFSLNTLRIISVLVIISFLRSAVLIQAQYKLSVGS